MDGNLAKGNGNAKPLAEDKEEKEYKEDDENAKGINDKEY
jgi:hypothetical protein